MVSQAIWIAIVISVFFVGIGVSYAHFANTYDPMSMKFQNQELFDQMMSHNLKMSQQWMNSDMMNQKQMIDMIERMQTDPELKQAMMEHMNRMSLSSENMMGSGMMNQDMMNSIMDDPELRQQMIDMMMNNPQMMDMIMNNQQFMQQLNP